MRITPPFPRNTWAMFYHLGWYCDSRARRALDNELTRGRGGGQVAHETADDFRQGIRIARSHLGHRRDGFQRGRLGAVDARDQGREAPFLGDLHGGEIGRRLDAAFRLQGEGGDVIGAGRAVLEAMRPRRRQANPDTLRRRLAARRGALIEMLRDDAPHGGPGSAAAIRGGQRARALGLEISQLAARSGIR